MVDVRNKKHVSKEVKTVVTLLVGWERWSVRGDCQAGPGGGADKLTEVGWADNRRQEVEITVSTSFTYKGKKSNGVVGRKRNNSSITTGEKRNLRV